MNFLMKNLDKLLAQRDVSFRELSSRMFSFEKELWTKNELLNQASEVYFDMVLEKKYQKEMLSAKENILGKKTHMYSFKESPQGRIIISNTLSQIVGEYDQCILLDKKPVIFEVKMGSYDSILRTLRKKKILKKRQPLVELFNLRSEEIPLIYVVPKDVYNVFSVEKHDYSEQFLQSNGQFLSFPFGKNEFFEQLQNYVDTSKKPFEPFYKCEKKYFFFSSK